MCSIHRRFEPTWPECHIIAYVGHAISLGLQVEEEKMFDHMNALRDRC